MDGAFSVNGYSPFRASRNPMDQGRPPRPRSGQRRRPQSAPPRKSADFQREPTGRGYGGRPLPGGARDVFGQRVDTQEYFPPPVEEELGGYVAPPFIPVLGTQEVLDDAVLAIINKHAGGEAAPSESGYAPSESGYAPSEAPTEETSSSWRHPDPRAAAYPPGYTGCWARTRPRDRLRPKSAPPKRLTAKDLDRLRELGRAKSARDPKLDQISGFTTSWGMDNGLLGYMKSTTKRSMEDVAARVNRGEVKRNRPLDEAIGRNIKFTNRHSGSLMCIAPNYGELDPRRKAKEERTAKALIAAYGPMAANSTASYLGGGGYGPWGGSLPCFTELHSNMLLAVPQRC